ncbi:hypothetical protein GCM10011519_34330 [Marmoricola endophyticus]|uniref:Acid phosphatase of HAD superfamily subfamily IIIB n=1 Tax=Marmoricola endophyticus TaxID=2040280 RepID=A0A917BVS6_9ACTN|nr:HAD family acid phosphatase [Marmoricola endophyticus]GGF57515.1 hypothetical protein GCM10011519_34330 [Marmoricola endophyticus]
MSLRARLSAVRPTVVIALATSALAAGVLVTGSADAGTAPSVPAPPAVPTSADQIQNIDQVKTAIKGYYGDTTTTTPDPINGTTMLHEPSPTSNWVKETNGVGREMRSYLAAQNAAHDAKAKKKVLLLDVDDTSLVTYDYEIYSNFVYNPTQNAEFVNKAVFPDVPAMLRTTQYAAGHGYTVMFLTGRPESQRAGTLLNLSKEGFPVTSANLYLNDASAPYLASCQPSCTTTQRKSLTRQYIESKGYDIVANVGDQYSDLNGGFADKTFKLPNPMYYLP